MTSVADQFQLAPAARTVTSASRAKYWLLFGFIAAIHLGFGLWANAQGYLPADALSRSMLALLSLHGSDPHLAAIGFVWMPLPSIIQLVWVAAYPIVPGIMGSGLSASLTTALASGLSAVVMLATARRLGLPDQLGLGYALLVALNPMLFLYGANGMSEGVAAPFLIGAVCSLVLFWHSGRRGYVAAAGTALALGFASLYEAVPFGAALFAALVLWLIRRPVITFPRGRRWAIVALGAILVVPSLYVAVAFITANAAIMGDPLYFARSAYSNASQTSFAESGGSFLVAGQFVPTLSYVMSRSWPFLILLAAFLIVRAMDRRLFRPETLGLVLLSLSVSFGLQVPMIYLHLSFGWLRFFMFPLFVAAGWGLYEVASSDAPRRAAVTILSAWVLAVPVVFHAMADPVRGPEESQVVRGLVTGQNAQQVGYEFGAQTSEMAPLAAYLQAGPFHRGERVLVDAFRGYPLAALAAPHHLSCCLILTPDRRFDEALGAPQDHGIDYLLVPDPAKVPLDAVNRAYPDLYDGRARGFKLVEAFPTTPAAWRLYKPVEEDEPVAWFEATRQPDHLGPIEPSRQLLRQPGFGDRGSHVKAWQRYLLDWDDQALPVWGVDGVYGPETDEWTKRFRASS